ALQRLAAEDPSFRVTSDEESGQTIIKGMGELHLDILVDRMKREFKVELVDGAFHDVDSSVLAFEIAARAGLRDAKGQLGMALLEPVMKVEVVTPEEYTGTVIGDLNSRRGQIQEQEMRGNANVVHAMVPLANMFGYVNALRSSTQGRAQYTMQFDHYERVPQAVQEEVQAKLAG
ncbi:MAG: hypothetical protein AAF742_05115, partial [Pseudomonadota bacterium]